MLTGNGNEVGQREIIWSSESNQRCEKANLYRGIKSGYLRKKKDINVREVNGLGAA